MAETWQQAIRRNHAQWNRARKATRAAELEMLDNQLREESDQRSAELATYTNEQLITELKKRGCPVRKTKPKSQRPD